MAKKRKDNTAESQRQSRKELLIARRREQQTRRVWIAVAGVVLLIGAVLVIGIVNELVLKPQRPVAIVNGTEINMRDWRDEVIYRRALLVSRVNDIAQLVSGDANQIQQIAGQELQLLSDPETLGLQVLEEMIDQELISQEAEARGIVVSEGEVQKEIEERFNYFEGESPTPRPTSTSTPIPTPSLTPIARVTLTESLDLEPTETPTAGPTNTPLPTPTAVSQESFQQSLSEWIDRLNDYGVDEAIFREEIKQSLLRERLTEQLASESEIAEEAEQASIYFLRFDGEQEAEDALEEIQSSDYLTIWNTVNSSEGDEDSESTAIAGELLWRTRDNIEGVLGPDIAEAAFELDVEQPSSIIVVVAESEDANDRYYIIMVSGREIRPLTEAAINSAKQQVLANWLDANRQIGVETFERWRANVPQRPLLDVSSWVFPTPVPTPTSGQEINLTPVATPG